MGIRDRLVRGIVDVQKELMGVRSSKQLGEVLNDHCFMSLVVANNALKNPSCRQWTVINEMLLIMG